MTRYCLLLDLRDDPELIAEYERQHAAVWPEVIAHLREAGVAVSPGLGFGHFGDDHVRFALVENRHRINQAMRGIKKVLSG